MTNSQLYIQATGTDEQILQTAFSNFKDGIMTGAEASKLSQLYGDAALNGGSDIFNSIANAFELVAKVYAASSDFGSLGFTDISPDDAQLIFDKSINNQLGTHLPDKVPNELLDRLANEFIKTDSVKGLDGAVAHGHQLPNNMGVLSPSHGQSNGLFVNNGGAPGREGPGIR